MGNKQVSSKKRTASINAEIQQGLEQERIRQKALKRIVMIGNGNCGKTTLKKMILHCFEADTDTMQDLSTRIPMNNIRSLFFNTIMNYLQHSQHADVPHVDLDSVRNDFDPSNFSLSRSGPWLQDLWQNTNMKEMYVRRAETNLWWYDNMEHWFEQIPQYMTTSYTPTFDDYLRLRLRTAGFCGYSYKDTSGKEYELVDVGGARAERKKWVNLLDGDAPDCILFVCALSHYAFSIFEDSKINGMTDSLQLFQATCQRKQKQTKVLVVFTKTDIFKQFLQYKPLSSCFGDEYQGKNYVDMPSQVYVNMMRRILQSLMVYVDEQNSKIYEMIPIDVLGVIHSYCDFVHECWMDEVCQDGVEFMKQKFLEIEPSIEFFVTQGFDLNVIKAMMQKIHARLRGAQ